MFVAMGLPSTSKLRDAAGIAPVRPSGGYIKDAETRGQVLRPDWRTTFTENSTWHTKMIAYMRQKIPVQNPAITKSMMENKTDDEILERLEVVFKNIATEYRKSIKTATGTSDHEADDHDDDEVDGKRVNRHKARKIRVRTIYLTIPTPINLL